MITSDVQKQALISTSLVGHSLLPFPPGSISVAKRKLLLSIYPFANSPTFKYICVVPLENRTCAVDTENRTCAIKEEIRSCSPGL